MKIVPKPIDIMKELNLLSWRSLLVGWKRRWATKQDVADFAADRLTGREDDVDLIAAQLAGSKYLTDSEILDLLLAAIASAEPKMDANTAATLSDWKPSTDLDTDVQREFKQWLVAHLVALSRYKGNADEIANLAEEVWTEFGYPQSLAGLSQSYSIFDVQHGTRPGENRRLSLTQILSQGIRELQEELQA